MSGSCVCARVVRTHGVLGTSLPITRSYTAAASALVAAVGAAPATWRDIEFDNLIPGVTMVGLGLDLSKHAADRRLPRLYAIAVVAGVLLISAWSLTWAERTPPPLCPPTVLLPGLILAPYCTLQIASPSHKAVRGQLNVSKCEQKFGVILLRPPRPSYGQARLIFNRLPAMFTESR